MRTIARYFSPVDAEHAAMHLRAHGIAAAVVGAGDPVANVISIAGVMGQFGVAVIRSADVDDATRLLTDFASEHAAHAPEPGWEDAAEPDLTKLDPALPIDCPACSRDLRPTIARMPAGAGTITCPDCAERVDLAARVVALHGPEALAACYPDESDPYESDDESDLPGDAELEPDAVARIDAALVCPTHGCRYPLAGLPDLGACPECGRGYDKRELRRRALGDTGSI